MSAGGWGTIDGSTKWPGQKCTTQTPASTDDADDSVCAFGVFLDNQTKQTVDCQARNDFQSWKDLVKTGDVTEFDADEVLDQFSPWTAAQPQQDRSKFFDLTSNSARQANECDDGWDSFEGKRASISSDIMKDQLLRAIAYRKTQILNFREWEDDRQARSAGLFKATGELLEAAEMMVEQNTENGEWTRKLLRSRARVDQEYARNLRMCTDGCKRVGRFGNAQATAANAAAGSNRSSVESPLRDGAKSKSHKTSIFDDLPGNLRKEDTEFFLQGRKASFGCPRLPSGRPGGMTESPGGKYASNDDDRNSSPKCDLKINQFSSGTYDEILEKLPNGSSAVKESIGVHSPCADRSVEVFSTDGRGLTATFSASCANEISATEDVSKSILANSPSQKFGEYREESCAKHAGSNTNDSQHAVLFPEFSSHLCLSSLTELNLQNALQLENLGLFVEEDVYGHLSKGCADYHRRATGLLQNARKLEQVALRASQACAQTWAAYTQAVEDNTEPLLAQVYSGFVSSGCKKPQCSWLIERKYRETAERAKNAEEVFLKDVIKCVAGLHELEQWRSETLRLLLRGFLCRLRSSLTVVATTLEHAFEILAPEKMSQCNPELRALVAMEKDTDEAAIRKELKGQLQTFKSFSADAKPDTLDNSGSSECYEQAEAVPRGSKSIFRSRFTLLSDGGSETAETQKGAGENKNPMSETGEMASSCPGEAARNGIEAAEFNDKPELLPIWTLLKECRLLRHEDNWHVPIIFRTGSLVKTAHLLTRSELPHSSLVVLQTEIKRLGGNRNPVGLPMKAVWKDGLLVLTRDRFLHVFKSKSETRPFKSVYLANTEVKRVGRGDDVTLEIRYKKRRLFSKGSLLAFRPLTTRHSDTWLAALDRACADNCLFDAQDALNRMTANISTKGKMEYNSVDPFTGKKCESLEIPEDIPDGISNPTGEFTVHGKRVINWGLYEHDEKSEEVVSADRELGCKDIEISSNNALFSQLNMPSSSLDDVSLDGTPP